MLVAIQFLKHRFFIVGFFIHLLFSLNGQNLLSNYSGNWGDEGFHFNVVNVESFDVRKLESPNYISDYLDLPKGSTLTPKFNQNKNSFTGKNAMKKIKIALRSDFFLHIFWHFHSQQARGIRNNFRHFL